MQILVKTFELYGFWIFHSSMVDQDWYGHMVSPEANCLIDDI